MGIEARLKVWLPFTCSIAFTCHCCRYFMTYHNLHQMLLFFCSRRKSWVMITYAVICNQCLTSRGVSLPGSAQQMHEQEPGRCPILCMPKAGSTGRHGVAFQIHGSVRQGRDCARRLCLAVGCELGAPMDAHVAATRPRSSSIIPFSILRLMRVRTASARNSPYSQQPRTTLQQHRHHHSTTNYTNMVLRSRSKRLELMAAMI